jgi:hypothetical protein
MKTAKLALLLIVCIITTQGCSLLGFKVKGSGGDYPRVDQELDGNLGYVEGEPLFTENPDYKSTRKLYNVEIEEVERLNAWEYILEKDAWLQENYW